MRSKQEEFQVGKDKAKTNSVSAEQKVNMLKRMIFYRFFEEKVIAAYTKQKFSGFCHLHIGQEAVCVGIGEALRPGDYVIGSYRSHTQAIEKGITPEAVFAELFGKVTGCSRGKGGSMHMFSKEHRFLGGHGIVGGQAPLAVGAAFTSKYRNEDDVTVCYLGDAAMNQGQVFEAMNLAATYTLPVLFVIENNKYGMGTDIHRTTSVKHLYVRALGFDMDHSHIDGMEVLGLYNHVNKIVMNMRQTKRPYLLEVNTYRYKGHSVSDPATYRTKEEVQKFQDQDPINQLKNHLLEHKLCTSQDIAEFEKTAKDEIKNAELRADEAPLPDVSEAFEHVFIGEGR